MTKQQFTRFAKDVKKELNLKGLTFTMNAKQEELRTATINGIHNVNYEKAIEQIDEAMNKYTAEELKDISLLQWREYYTNLLHTYGTSYQRALDLLNRIKNSYAIMQLGEVKLSIELQSNTYIIRLNY